MIVKRSIVERWYQKDSWVYRQFSYLFENQLWDGTVPNGFSVCPYFWLSLFSFFVFKPFEFILYWIFRPPVLFFGKPARVVDRYFALLAGRCGFFSGANLHRAVGLGFLFLIGILFFGFIITFLWYKAIAWAYYTYKTFDGDLPAKYCYWSIISVIGLFFYLCGYMIATKTECKVLNYLWLWLAAFIVGAMILIPETVASMCWSTLYGTGHFFGFIGHGFKVMFMSLGVFLATLFGLLWQGTKWTFVFQPVKTLLLPWWAYFLIFAAMFWITGKIAFWLDEWDYNRYRSRQDAEINRSKWLDIFMRVLELDTDYLDGKALARGLTGSAIIDADNYDYRAAQQCRDLIFETAFNLMWQERMKNLEKVYPATYQLKWAKVRASGSPYSGFIVIEKDLDVSLGFSDYNYREFVRKAINEPTVQKEIKKLADNYRSIDEEREARRNAKKSTWAHEACMVVTAWIGEKIRALGRGIAWIFVNLWTMIAYLWMLIKAKKQGACPFFPFTDGKEVADSEKK